MSNIHDRVKILLIVSKICILCGMFAHSCVYVLKFIFVLVRGNIFIPL